MSNRFSSAPGAPKSIHPIDAHGEAHVPDGRPGAPTVVICGSIHQDTMAEIGEFPSPGEAAIVGHTSFALGGKGANQASAVAKAGVHAVMAGTVGEDPAADAVLSALADNGVDTRAVQTSWDRPTGSAFIASTPDGNHIVYVTRAANNLTEPMEFADEIAGADVLLAQGELRPEATEQLSAIANLHGTRFVLNLAPVTVVTPTLIDSADPLIVNRTEAWEIMRKLDVSDGILRGDLEATVETLLQYSPSVIVSMGDMGCVYARAEVDGGDGVIWYQPALQVPADEVIDTTGAGDAFAGTVAAEIARGADFATAVALATAAGSLAVRSLGATSSYADLDVLQATVASPDFPKRMLLSEATQLK